MTEQVSITELNTAVDEKMSLHIAYLEDESTVEVGDCLVGVKNESSGIGYVVVVKPGANKLLFLDGPLDLYEIEGMLAIGKVLSEGDCITTISYVREYHEKSYYYWNDETFFYRVLKDHEGVIYGIDVMAQNNNDFTCYWNPGIGWEIQWDADQRVLAVIAPVDEHNPVLDKSWLLSLIKTEDGDFFHYTVNQLAPFDENMIAGISGSILIAMFATLKGFLLSYGQVAMVDDPEGTFGEGAVQAISITNPDGTIDYTGIPLEYFQKALH